MPRLPIAAATMLALAVLAAPAPTGEKNAATLKMGLVNLRCLTSAGPDAEANQANIQAIVDEQERQP